MREILAALTADARVLDLGSGHGSFPDLLTAAIVVRLDLDAIGEKAVRADAARLPFRDAAFDAIIANHSFEHFAELSLVLSEVGRVLKPGGAIFASVPDASTWADRVYRWLGRGGGHVNAFIDPMDLAGKITDATGRPLSGMRVLHSGWSILNRKNMARVQRRLWLFGGGYEWTLQAGTYIFRWLDSLTGSRLAIYGWAYYFGTSAELDLTETPNVCVRCGAGNSAQWLTAGAMVKRFLFWRYYRCPGCSTVNLFL